MSRDWREDSAMIRKAAAEMRKDFGEQWIRNTWEAGFFIAVADWLDSHVANHIVQDPRAIRVARRYLGEDVPCGYCGQSLADERGFTGSPAYHRECAKEVYGEEFREVEVCVTCGREADGTTCDGSLGAHEIGGAR